MPFCPSCGIEYSEQDDFLFCPECGFNLSQQQEDKFAVFGNAMKKCPVCGEYTPADGFYCLLCGHSFTDMQDEEEDFDCLVQQVQMMSGTWKNKWVALLLCIFLGVFGAHKFYEEKVGIGLLYLFSFGLFGIGWFFDIVQLALKPNPYKAKK